MRTPFLFFTGLSGCGREGEWRRAMVSGNASLILLYSGVFKIGYIV